MPVTLFKLLRRQPTHASCLAASPLASLPSMAPQWGGIRVRGGYTQSHLLNAHRFALKPEPFNLQPVLNTEHFFTKTPEITHLSHWCRQVETAMTLRCVFAGSIIQPVFVQIALDRPDETV